MHISCIPETTGFASGAGWLVKALSCFPCLKRLYCIKQTTALVVVLNWLAGNLDSLKEYSEDEVMLDALNQWLSLQIQKFDPLMIGLVQCKECNTTWDALTYEQTAKKHKCLACGAKNSTPLL